MLTYLKQHWLSNLRGDVLSALVVALALIPEAIAFSIIAGVDPKVGLYASFCIAVITAFAGGRPAMISAATGAMALVMVTLVREHGLQVAIISGRHSPVVSHFFEVIWTRSSLWYRRIVDQRYCRSQQTVGM
jgi:SulP family sulfate permease